MSQFNPFTSRKRHIVPDYKVDAFPYGLITKLKDEKTLPKGASADSLNWRTRGDRIELRRGYSLLGQTRQNGSGKITGLVVGQKADGTQIPFYTHGRKIKYYDSVTDDTYETGADTLPAVADGEDIALENYHNLAGVFIMVSSKNSSIYKIATANPGSVQDELMTNHKGKIKLKKGRTFLWDRKDTRGGRDQTSLYGSWIDKDELSDYGTISNETFGAGDGATTAFAHTMTGVSGRVSIMQVSVIAFRSVKAVTGITKAAFAVVTCVGHGFASGDYVLFQGVGGMIEINGVTAQINNVVDANTFWVNLDTTGYSAYTAGGNVGPYEYFIDDGNGVLTGDHGGAGTVNYITMACAVALNLPAPNTTTIWTTYYWENPTSASAGTANSGGFLDFTKSSPRTAGQGFVVPQPDDGAFQNLFFINDIAFCFHESLTYKFTLTKDDTNATNEIYRSKVGLPYWLAACETGDGIPYVDAIDQNNPAVRVLGFAANSQEIIPLSISVNLDLSPYSFDSAVLMEWGEYLVLACRQSSSPANDRMFIRFKDKGYWDVMDYYASRLGILNGALIAGDSISNNIYTLFSGLDDDGSEILNHWTGAETNCDVDGLKRIMMFAIDGLIGPGQYLKISLSLDNGSFVEIRDPNRPTEYAVQWDGPYVDKSQAVHIGGPTEGSTEIGGGGGDGDITAWHFRREFVIATDLCEYVQPKFEGVGIGWLAVNSYKFKDIRYKGRRQALRYET